MCRPMATTLSESPTEVTFTTSIAKAGVAPSAGTQHPFVKSIMYFHEGLEIKTNEESRDLKTSSRMIKYEKKDNVGEGRESSGKRSHKLFAASQFNEG